MPLGRRQPDLLARLGPSADDPLGGQVNHQFPDTDRFCLAEAARLGAPAGAADLPGQHDDRCPRPLLQPADGIHVGGLVRPEVYDHYARVVHAESFRGR
jgi:hypothetical protein